MPELPEVEVVRRGLDRYVAGETIVGADVTSPRAARRQDGGSAELEARIIGRTIGHPQRRGKFLWLPLYEGVSGLEGEPETALLVHLGMSGQMLVKGHDLSAAPQPAAVDDVRQGNPVALLDAPQEITSRGAQWRHQDSVQRRHLRAAMELSSGASIWFVDQRTFGYWWAGPVDHGLPLPVRHIARDLLDPNLDVAGLAEAIHGKHTEMKRILLNQSVVSGIGNIYADEMLWEAQIHPRQRADRVARPRIIGLLQAGREVMNRALAQGGTSFDSLYVNVNGESGYFSRSLNAYGRAGQPCPRCGTPIVREVFMNRSSHLCPVCQRRH